MSRVVVVHGARSQAEAAAAVSSAMSMGAIPGPAAHTRPAVATAASAPVLPGTMGVIVPAPAPGVIMTHVEESDDEMTEEELKQQLRYDLGHGKVVAGGSFWEDYRFFVRNGHPVLSVFMAHELHPFSRGNRLKVLLCMLMLAFIATTGLTLWSRGFKCPPCHRATTCSGCVVASGFSAGTCSSCVWPSTDAAVGDEPQLFCYNRVAAIAASERAVRRNVTEPGLPFPSFNSSDGVCHDVALVAESSCDTVDAQSNNANSMLTTSDDTTNQLGAAGDTISSVHKNENEDAHPLATAADDYCLGEIALTLALLQLGALPILVALVGTMLKRLSTCACLENPDCWSCMRSCGRCLGSSTVNIVMLALGVITFGCIIIMTLITPDFQGFVQSWLLSKALSWFYWFLTSMPVYCYSRSVELERGDEMDLEIGK
eukprot:PLAT3050.1.p1 GENE.PLAT3050.1~~PLAT3050.1.p1  ORF type:complete len:429 (+),score=146.16 PLAT3050.1:272-1558(+)